MRVLTVTMSSNDSLNERLIAQVLKFDVKIGVTVDQVINVRNSSDLSINYTVDQVINECIIEQTCRSTIRYFSRKIK